MKKRLLIGIAVALCFFIITNPPLGAFKDYTGKKTGLTRQYNFFVFSIYNDHGGKYVGLFCNFFLVKRAPVPRDYSQMYTGGNDSCPTCINLFQANDTTGKIHKRTRDDIKIDSAINEYLKLKKKRANK